MDDHKIVALYWQRSENAIHETHAKYGHYCFSIAHNILPIREDAEESVNDTYMAAWNAMPPHRPAMLSTFLGKLTRDPGKNPELFWGWLDRGTLVLTAHSSSGGYYVYVYQFQG